jgi:hypothetical protein
MRVHPDAQSGVSGARIAVAGHRHLIGPERLRAAIGQALDRLEDHFRQPLIILSALAEGADRLVAQEALRRGNAGLVVPLPMPPVVYQRGFDVKSREEFNRLLARADQVVELSTGNGRPDAFERLAAWLLDQADGVLAVWDGQAPRGRGGTGAVVTRARRLGLPLAWVHAARPGDETPAHPHRDGISFERLGSSA